MLVGRDDADGVPTPPTSPPPSASLRFGGYLAGGMTSWREDRRPVDRIERVPLDELHERWQADRDRVQVLDVRERDEWDAGHIPGSAFTPYHDVVLGSPTISTPTGVIAVVCASGQRAAVGGEPAPAPRGDGRWWHVVDGGVPRWERQGWQTTVRP